MAQYIKTKPYLSEDLLVLNRYLYALGYKALARRCLHGKDVIELLSKEENIGDDYLEYLNTHYKVLNRKELDVSHWRRLKYMTKLVKSEVNLANSRPRV